MKRKRVNFTPLAIVFAVILLASTCVFLCACGEEQKDGGPITQSVVQDSKNAYTFGNIDIDISTEDVLKHFTLGDEIQVKIQNGETYKMPLVASYDDVSPGELLIRAKEGESVITLSVNYGQFGIQSGLMQKAPDGSANKYEWVDGKLPCKVELTLSKKGAYLDRLEVGKLKESNDQAAYPNLNDEQFANFREIKVGTIRSGVFYRSTTPIDPQLGRNKIADQACANHNVKSILNLQDSESEAKAFEGFANTYYSKTNVTYQKMSMALGTDTFNKNIATCLRFFVNNDGPYMCHCVYGKDRTGIVCAIVEALCGATKDQIVNDYATTYTNLYDVQDGTQQPIKDEVKKTIDNLIINNMSYAFKTEITADNINQKTEEYVLSIGLTKAEIDTLRAKLS